MSSLLLHGYQVIRQLITPAIISNLRQAIASYIETSNDYGIRELHRQISLVDKLAHSQLILKTLHQQTNHRQFRLIKAIYFNKNANHNWSVPWHQDKTIAVRNKVNLANFKNWTVKRGVPHVQPPLEILHKITTIRIALDCINSDNGGLKIVPDSHRLGVLNGDEINHFIQQRSPLSLNMQAGDALIMHPLLLHSSNKSLNCHARRVIHLEYSSSVLSKQLAWY